MDGVGGWISGTPVCANCFATSNDNVRSEAWNENFHGNETSRGEATCSRAGLFMDTGNQSREGEWAKVMVQNTLVTGDVAYSWVVE